MRDIKYHLDDDIMLSIVSKSSRMLPPSMRETLKRGGHEMALVLQFNPTGDESYQPSMVRDARKAILFEGLKANTRLASQNLWLGEMKDPHTLNAYMIANPQSLMALTEQGILNQVSEQETRALLSGAQRVRG